MEKLRNILQRIDGRGYKAYKDITGKYKFPDYDLFIDYVQGDPFAAPSRLRVRINQNKAGFPQALFNNRVRRIALEDTLIRFFAQQIDRHVKGNRGTGKSGMIAIDKPGQQRLERTAMVVNDAFVEARFVIGLPAQGRRVLARQAIAMIFDELPAVVRASLNYQNLDKSLIQTEVELAEDQASLRQQLAHHDLVAFLANGSILPRRSGVSDLPLQHELAVPFQSPSELEVTLEVPNRGKISGMGIPKGVTLIVGGGYHGKSTLLRGVERGIYDHVTGDGREYVVTDSSAVKIRSEDGRSAVKVDISTFINNLPHGDDTRHFSSENTSGSTSQATNIVESLEMGAKVLLIDEDTSATNFMIRDARMQKLVAKDKEPITPFIDTVRSLWEDYGVSTVMVLGGSGDYFDVADHVVALEEYRPKEVTARAKQIVGQLPTQRTVQRDGELSLEGVRIPLAQGFDASRGRKTKVDAKGLHKIVYGRTSIDLDYVEQLVDVSQTRTIADLIVYAAKKYVDGRRTLKQVIEAVFQDIENQGLDVLSPYYGQNPGDYAYVRPMEVASAINRLRSLIIR